MLRPIATIMSVVMLALGAGHVFAHENFRIIGTLTKHQDSEIEVRKKDGKTTTITLDKKTVVSRDKKKLAIAALKVGQSVVVEAYGDDEFDLLALEIRIVPAIAAAAKK